MLIAWNIFDELHVKGDHLIQQLLSQVVRVEELL